MDVSGYQRDFNLVYEALPNGPIKTAVQDVIQSLKNDSLPGEHVKRNQIPKYYIKRHGVQILYRIALPQHWRLIYTLLTLKKKEKPKAFLLELIDHDKYNKRFGYFKKKSS